MSNPTVYILSDSVGETGELVLKAALSQFGGIHLNIIRKSFLTTELQLAEALEEVEANQAAVIYTLVRPELMNYLEQRLHKSGIPHADLMGPVIDVLASLTNLTPRNEPGLIRKVDDAYFTKIEAIEFAVKFDDGKDPRGLLKSDIVITGVSRTSKTPLCMYLAHKGLKAANIPLVIDIAPPEELFLVPPSKVVGLTIKPSLLMEIRKERLKTMGLGVGGKSDYASLERILEELKYAEDIMRRIGCPILDVTSKATEETAARVLDIYRKGVIE
ncbi:pyruvate, water dikinase regulatory protein [Azotosporobacter soli]|uniref:pyruvate, water dikinase regulatory protein n=1 Tax=Azotosporobacter soli TaxID=3055040 RepID=UPI0031FED285